MARSLDVPLIASPPILRDRAWEIATLGPSVRVARRLLARQLREGVCDDDARGKIGDRQLWDEKGNE